VQDFSFGLELIRNSFFLRKGAMDRFLDKKGPHDGALNRWVLDPNLEDVKRIVKN